MNTPQLNKSNLAFAVLVGASLLRLPGEGEMRAMTRVTTEMVMVFGLAAWIAYYINPWVGLFLALASVTAAFPIFDRFAYWRREAIVFGAVWYAFVNGLDRDHLLDAVCIVVVVNLFAVLMQYFGIDPYAFFSFGLMDSHSDGRIIGLLFNENELSALFGISFWAFSRGPLFVFMPFIVIGIFLTKSSVGLAAAGVSVGVWLLATRRYKSIAILLALVFVAVFFYDKNIAESFAWRMNYNAIAAQIIIDHPLGIGLGHWHKATNQLHAHNDIIQMTVEMGAVVLAIFSGFVVSFIRKTDLTGIIFLSAIMAASLVSFAWFIPTTGLIMVTLIAASDGKKNANCN